MLGCNLELKVSAKPRSIKFQLDVFLCVCVSMSRFINAFGLVLLPAEISPLKTDDTTSEVLSSFASFFSKTLSLPL